MMFEKFPHDQATRLMQRLACVLLALCFSAIVMPADAQSKEDERAASKEKFDGAASDIQKRLEASLAELAALREQIKKETLPLSRELTQLESQLKDAKRELKKVSNISAARGLEKGNLERQIKDRQESAVYLSNFMDDYVRKLDAGLHVAERDRYTDVLDAAKLVMENRSLADTPEDRYGPQIDALEASLARLEEALGGASFAGTAMDESGRVHNGTVMLFGPVGVFAATDAPNAGLIDKAPGTDSPVVVAYTDPLNTQAATDTVVAGGGVVALDTTLGNAAIIEVAEGSLMDEIKAGGIVMIPIAFLAGFSMLLGVIKMILLLCVRKPGKKRIQKLLDAVATRKKDNAVQAAKTIPGPAGKMLRAGVDHLDEPRELIEEVMYEQVLTTRLKVQRVLPFIAICAAAAPLLGLLGTVMGIIETFEMMRLFDSSNMKNVSGGISVALITTKFGLVVAIPALLFHAFLSRLAKSVVDNMEKSGVAFINQVMKTPPHTGEQTGASLPKRDPDPTDPEPKPTSDNDSSGGDFTEGSEQEEMQGVEEAEKEPVLAQAGAGMEGGSNPV